MYFMYNMCLYASMSHDAMYQCMEVVNLNNVILSNSQKNMSVFVILFFGAWTSSKMYILQKYINYISELKAERTFMSYISSIFSSSISKKYLLKEENCGLNAKILKLLGNILGSLTFAGKKEIRSRWTFKSRGKI